MSDFAALGRARYTLKNAGIKPLFFGIIIRMYMEVGEPHHLPHFHAYYQNDVAVFSLEPIDLIAGSLPRRQRRFVEAWAELHQDELLADWERLQAGEPPLPIEPLD
jgi:Domain of unknown function (DUF4160)